MLDKTLTQLETNIRQSDALQAEKKAELLRLLTTLKADIAALEQTHAEHAASVVESMAQLTLEAIRQTRDPQLVDSATQSLSTAVTELEVSHPQLVQTVNAISVLLSSIGI
jgi:hypothetical protein